MNNNYCQDKNKRLGEIFAEIVKRGDLTAEMLKNIDKKQLFTVLYYRIGSYITNNFATLTDLLKEKKTALTLNKELKLGKKLKTLADIEDRDFVDLFIILWLFSYNAKDIVYPELAFTDESSIDDLLYEFEMGVSFVGCRRPIVIPYICKCLLSSLYDRANRQTIGILISNPCEISTDSLSDRGLYSDLSLAFSKQCISVLHSYFITEYKILKNLRKNT